MGNNRIAFLDSGIGGISVMNYFYQRLNGHTFIYYGDNYNAPYGNKTVRELKERAFIIVKRLLEYKPKAIVVACNTLSTNLLSFIKEISTVPIIPIFPPVESLLLNDESIILLCTKLTASIYKKQYCKEVESGRLRILGLERLAKEVEKKAFCLQNIKIEEHLSENNAQYLVGKDVKISVILGCTHYNFAKKQIFSHFCPLKIIDESELCFNNYKKLIGKFENLKNTSKNQVIFVGDCSKINEKFWKEVVKIV